MGNHDSAVWGFHKGSVHIATTVAVTFDGNHRYTQCILQIVSVTLVVAAVDDQVNARLLFKNFINLI